MMMRARAKTAADASSAIVPSAMWTLSCGSLGPKTRATLTQPGFFACREFQSSSRAKNHLKGPQIKYPAPSDSKTRPRDATTMLAGTAKNHHNPT